jgi:hypothetical protein
MLCQGKHATNKTREKASQRGVDRREPTMARSNPGMEIIKEHHQSIHGEETTYASSKSPKSLASESGPRVIGKQKVDFPHD